MAVFYRGGSVLVHILAEPDRFAVSLTLGLALLFC